MLQLFIPQLFGKRSLSCINLWPNYLLHYLQLYCVIVIILNASQIVYSGKNSTALQCQCNSTIDTSKCNCSDIQSNTCLPGEFYSGNRCEKCNCNLHTSLNNACKDRTGQCFCKENVMGQNCTYCFPNFEPNHSSSGELLNCSKQCPTGFKTTMNNKCVKENSTSSWSSAPMTTSHGLYMLTDSMVASSAYHISFTKSLVSSTSIIIQSNKRSPSTQIPSPSTQIPSPTVESSSTLSLPAPSSSVPSSQSPALPSQSPSLPLLSPMLSSSKVPELQSSSPAPTSQPSSSSRPPHSSLSLSSSPPTSSPSSPPSSSSPSSPPTTGKPVTTKTPPISTKNPTTDDAHTSGHKSSTKPETDRSSSEKPTIKMHQTEMPKKDRGSDVVVIVLTCLGVLVILGIAIAVGCYCLRSKRKQSTPFWTVELSSTRNNEDVDLLDPITDDPHKKVNDVSDADASITEHARYYAYI